MDNLSQKGNLTSCKLTLAHIDAKIVVSQTLQNKMKVLVMFRDGINKDKVGNNTLKTMQSLRNSSLKD